MVKRLVNFLILILIISFCKNSLAQGERNNWYFGNNAGINFVSGEPVVDLNGSIDVWEGCTSISSSEGELLFYSNGVSVYDSSHSRMPHGSGLLGDPSSAQSILIIPKPGDNNKYYLFTIDDIDPGGGSQGLNYSLVDMTLNDSLGDIVESEKNINLTKPMCEKIAATEHINGVDIWVVTQKWETNYFYAYLVTNEGVNPDPIISAAGKIIQGGIDNAKGYMKISHDGNMLVKANAGLRMIEIFDFDNFKGKVSNGYMDNDFGGESYGIEFSPNNRYLYAGSWKSNPGEYIYQYDLEAGSPNDIIDSRMIIATGTNGALQMGPDNKIYVANAQKGFLSRINFPDVSGPDCGFENEGVYLEGRNSMWGLPNFVSVPADTTVGIYQTKERHSSPLEIYPNPVKENFSISIIDPQKTDYTVLFYDEQGRFVERKKLSSG